MDVSENWTEGGGFGRRGTHELGEHALSVAGVGGVDAGGEIVAQRPLGDASWLGVSTVGDRFKRGFDVILAIIALTLLAPVLVIIWCLVRLGSNGPGLYWSPRVGRFRRVFMMPKFRTMMHTAPCISRELIDNPSQYYARFGRMLRRLSIDELPQLYSILRGEMSFVGPRPLLPQDPVQAERSSYPQVFSMRPGLTGLAQVRGRNMIAPRRKARLDAFYVRMQSAGLDMLIMWQTVIALLTGLDAR